MMHRIGCDCCNGREMMAIEFPDRIEIKAKHHGKYHVLTLPKSSIDIATDQSYRSELRDRVLGSTN